jgi:hypothetical protein
VTNPSGSPAERRLEPLSIGPVAVLRCGTARGDRRGYDSLVVRNGKKARRLIVGDQIFLWSVRHEHDVDLAGELASRYRDCREVLSLRMYGLPGRLLITFSVGDGRIVSDGMLPGGTVGTTGSGWLNLNEPGTVRALLDEALVQGWTPTTSAIQLLDGWQFFDTHRQAR